MILMIKPASGSCNLRCRYCFYADEMAHRKRGIVGMMSTELLDIVVKKALEHARYSCTFMFQGGEPTLSGLDFYRSLIVSVKRHNTARLPVSYAIQTNGYAIDAEWARFFAQNKFLVGLSLDGPREIHDENRSTQSGEGSFKKVIATAGLLAKHGVEFNILSVVTSKSARQAVSIYNYFKKCGFGYQQYIPCIEAFGRDYDMSCDSESSPFLDAEHYGAFLCRMFDAWYADLMSGTYVYNRTFENWVGMLLGRPPENCAMAGECSVQYVVEADGSVYPCDFYVLDEYRLGNLLSDSFEDIDRHRCKIGFVESSKTTDPECICCRWHALCRGGCRRDREQVPGQGGSTRSRFCASYKKFFDYAGDRLFFLAENIRKYGTIRPFSRR